MTELEVQRKIFLDLRRNHAEVFMEVPVFSRSVDLIFREYNSTEIRSMEIKLSNWRRAVTQAIDHSLVVDRAYICIPELKKGISEDLKQLLEQTGIGLYLFRRTRNNIAYRKIVEAKRPNKLWKPARARLESIFL